MSMIQRDLNLRNHQVVTLAEDLRASSGSRKLIESGMKRKLRTKNCQLSDYFEKKVCNFVEVNKKEKTKNNFTQNVVVCNDLNGLIDKLILERGVDEKNMLIRIGLDGGGGFMKICLSIFESESKPPPAIKKRKRLRGFRCQKRWHCSRHPEELFECETALVRD